MVTKIARNNKPRFDGNTKQFRKLRMLSRPFDADTQLWVERLGMLKQISEGQRWKMLSSSSDRLTVQKCLSNAGRKEIFYISFPQRMNPTQISTSCRLKCLTCAETSQQLLDGLP